MQRRYAECGSNPRLEDQPPPPLTRLSWAPSWNRADWLRNWILSETRAHRNKLASGVENAHSADAATNIARLGKGSLGGKGRGFRFLHSVSDKVRPATALQLPCNCPATPYDALRRACNRPCTAPALPLHRPCHSTAWPRSCPS